MGCVLFFAEDSVYLSFRCIMHIVSHNCSESDAISVMAIQRIFSRSIKKIDIKIRR